MNLTQRNVLKSLRERIEMATLKIRQAEEEIVYHNQVIIESKELIEKLLTDAKQSGEDKDEMQDMQLK